MAALSQELFDETVLENEECFDLSPDEALRETIDEFCKQLGVEVPTVGGININNDNAPSSSSLSADHGISSPTSVANSNAAETGESSESAAVVSNDVVMIPAALSHLILTHPNSSEGKLDRLNRSQFQNGLTLLDKCVNTDGTVAIPDASDEVLLEALAEIGRRCRFGDLNGDDKSEIDNNDSTKNSSPLPYLAIFQRTSSIYTFMSLLSVIDPTKLSNHTTELSKDDPKLKILTAATQTLSSLLVNNPNRDDGKCFAMRAELRDLFVPALGRLVCLVGGVIKTIISSSRENPAPDASVESLSLILCDLLQLGTNATRGCEGAKVSWVQSTLASELNLNDAAPNKRGGVAVIVSCLSLTNENGSGLNNTTRILTEACQLLASLCRYDDFRDPSSTANNGAMAATGVSTSSAHDHAMEFNRAGASTLLVKIARGVLSELEHCGDSLNGAAHDLVAKERLASAVLTALRVLAVNDDIIQTMVALGVLPIVTKALELGVMTDTEGDDNDTRRNKQRLAAASLGLLRNLCGNDEIKTNLCLGSTNESLSKFATPSILPHLLKAMQIFPSVVLTQEHACGTIAAMALRRPKSARAILDAGGPRLVLTAMKRHDMNVNVQRQGALAVRNIVSRLLRDLPEDDGSAPAENAGNERSSIRDAFLELGAEDVLRNIAGRHQGSVDEAYAALRDLGCTVSLLKFNSDDLQKESHSVARTMMFGEKHNTSFRPVYEESEGLEDGVDSAASQFGA